MSFFRGLWRSNSKHKKLCEEWALANSCESVGPGASSASTSGSCSTASASTSASASSSRSGPDDAEAAPETTFELKYLGSTPVESPSSEKETAEAINTIISLAKASGKRLQRVTLSVSLRGIRMTDLATAEEQLRVSIYRISYCSADGTHDHVFAFIATNPNETMECHAYLCPKRKIAQNVTLTVAQAFNTAYELWQLAQLDSPIYHAQDKSSSQQQQQQQPIQDKQLGVGTEGTRLQQRQHRELDEPEERGKAAVSETNKPRSGQNSSALDAPKEPVVTARRVASWVSFEDEAVEADEAGAIPLKPLKSPSCDSSSSGDKNVVDNDLRNCENLTRTTRQRQQQQQQQQRAPSGQENASTSARGLDLVCSS